LNEGSPIVFASTKDYLLWREVFPNPSDNTLPARVGELRFEDFANIMRNPPLFFPLITSRGCEKKFEREARDGWPKGVLTMHTPHNGPLYKGLLDEMRERMRKTFGWRGEHFVLEEKA
jgi:hypothetical protein